MTIANRLLFGKTKPALESNANMDSDNIVPQWYHEIKAGEGLSESNSRKNSFLGLAQNKSELALFYPLIQPDIALKRVL